MIWLAGYLVLGVLVTLGMWVWDRHSYSQPNRAQVSLSDLVLNTVLWPLALFCAVYDP